MNKPLAANKYLLLFLLALTIALLIEARSVFLISGIDWHETFYPAVQELLHGRSPYNIKGFFNPPWAAILLIPFAIVPENIGQVLMTIAGAAAYAYTAHKLGANKLTIALLLFSPPFLYDIYYGNIDWLAVLGVVLPPWLGLFFLAIKPQVGMIVVLYLFFAEWRKGGFWQVLKTFLPLGVVSIVSVIIFGPWFLKIPAVNQITMNGSLFPLILPVGLAFAVTSIRKNDLRYALIASPMLSPYLLLYSWIGAFLALAPKPYETAAAVIGMWFVVALRFFS